MTSRPVEDSGTSCLRRCGLGVAVMNGVGGILLGGYLLVWRLSGGFQDKTYQCCRCVKKCRIEKIRE